MTLRRGFKAEAERIAAELRRDLRLGESQPIDPRNAATQRGIAVRSADALIARSRLEQLEGIQAGCFSACTLRSSSERTVIVFNPLNAKTRQRSDVAHELAHLLLNHRLSRLEYLGDAPFLSCDATQEEEANWLAGCLLLPRALLLHAVRSGKSAAEISRECGVSEQLAQWRVNVTGVRRQLGRPD
jgi:Zn-dependent peptidase ImmA (M78 family)